MNILFGIKNCDTVKRAKKWLNEHYIDYQFHDFREDGINDTVIRMWLNQLDYDSLLNKKSTTWRQLPESQKTDLCEQTAIQLMVANPTVIKRPVLITDEMIHVGYTADDYCRIFGIANV